MSKNTETVLKRLFNLSYLALTLILITILLTTRPCGVFGDSMSPTLKDGELTLVLRKWVASDFVERGSIITFSPADGSTSISTNLVKRVIAIGGDKIECKNNVVYVNDVALDEPYIKEKMINPDFSYIVPEGCVFVMGDNRNDSLDSRFEAVGYVNLDKQLIGTIIF